MELSSKQYKEFVDLYKQAIENKQESFVFYGQQIFAKHLLTYYKLRNDRL